MHSLKPTNCSFALLASLVLPFPARYAEAGMMESKNNFSQQVWSTTGLRRPCREPHNNDPANRIVPLWAPTTANPASFKPYTSPTGTMHAMDRGSQPGGASLACLSCHDGVTATNQTFIGRMSGASQMPSSDLGLIGTDLTRSHPISITYDSALAATDVFLRDPSTLLSEAVSGPLPGALQGKTIAQALLQNGKVECTSCHDVHSNIGSVPGNRYRLLIDGVGSDHAGDRLCRVCHTL